MTRMRVVVPDDPPTEVSFEEAARAAMEKALATSPGGLLILAEHDGVLEWFPVPPLESMARGMIDLVYEELHPAPSDE